MDFKQIVEGETLSFIAFLLIGLVLFLGMGTVFVLGFLADYYLMLQNK